MHATEWEEECSLKELEYSLKHLPSLFLKYGITDSNVFFKLYN